MIPRTSMILLNRVYLRGQEFDIFGSLFQERLQRGSYTWYQGGLGEKEIKIILGYPLFGEILSFTGKYDVHDINMIKLYIHITKLNKQLITINYNKHKTTYK